MRICGIIVTYNRKKLLLENLKQLFNQSYQLDKIFIVDNHGNDNTLEYLHVNGIDMSKIDFSYLEENIGGAGGFSYGLSKAYVEGFDWYMLMDDDGKPANCESIKIMVSMIENREMKSKDNYLLNSLVINDQNNSELAFGICGCTNVQALVTNKYVEDGLIMNQINPFNSTFISNGLVQKIGFPNKDFFIKGDEVDYERRAKEVGAFVATVFESKYEHPKVMGKKIWIPFKGEREVQIEAPWKEYYSIRNATYTFLKFGERKAAFKYYIRKLACVFLNKCNKIQTIKMINLGYRHGKQGKLGKKVSP